MNEVAASESDNGTRIVEFYEFKGAGDMVRRLVAADWHGKTVTLSRFLACPV